MIMTVTLSRLRRWMASLTKALAVCDSTSFRFFGSRSTFTRSSSSQAAAEAAAGDFESESDEAEAEAEEAEAAEEAEEEAELCALCWSVSMSSDLFSLVWWLTLVDSPLT